MRNTLNRPHSPFLGAVKVPLAYSDPAALDSMPLMSHVQIMAAVLLFLVRSWLQILSHTVLSVARHAKILGVFESKHVTIPSFFLFLLEDGLCYSQGQFTLTI